MHNDRICEAVFGANKMNRNKGFQYPLRMLLWMCCVSFMAFCITILSTPLPVQANGYEMVLEDDADLFTAQEEAQLKQVMQPITEYGNVAFKSVSTYYGSTDSFAESYYKGLWGRESGTVFVIDMANRMIYIYSDGAVYRSITKSYANTITDNVYTYASAADYYTCAAKAYEQMYTILEGGRIAQPMKYASNACLAVILSFILLYFWVKMVSKAKAPSESELLRGIEMSQYVDGFRDQFTHETKTYSPQSSGGGGSSGGGHSGGGGGGGGGHRF